MCAGLTVTPLLPLLWPLTITGEGVVQVGGGVEVTTSFELRLCSRISEVVVVGGCGGAGTLEVSIGMFFLPEAGASEVPFSTTADDKAGSGWSLISCGWTVSDDDVATVVSVDVGEEDEDEGEALMDISKRSSLG